MRKFTLLFSLLLLLASAPPNAGAVTPGEPEKLPPSRIEMPDKAQEDACDCCQKCEAARRPELHPEKEGTDNGNGCDDCCERCGRVLPNTPHESPPDIIDKPKK
jgi:hypothetical protein